MTSAETDAPLLRQANERGVATLTLDSPANRNALSTALIEALLDALESLAGDSAVRAVVLAHTGPVFCSGADLKETAAAIASGSAPVTRLGELLCAVWDFPKLVLARVGGPARAGGLGLIAAADIAVCADTASFGFSEVRIGVVPAVISATVLRRISARAAAELFLTGQTFTGARAAEIGLVSASVPADELDNALHRYLNDLRRAAPGALATTKALLRERSGSLRPELAELTATSVRHFRSPEGREGMAAFTEKREPTWVLPG